LGERAGGNAHLAWWRRRGVRWERSREASEKGHTEFLPASCCNVRVSTRQTMLNSHTSAAAHSNCRKSYSETLKRISCSSLLQLPSGDEQHEDRTVRQETLYVKSHTRSVHVQFRCSPHMCGEHTSTSNVWMYIPHLLPFDRSDSSEIVVVLYNMVQFFEYVQSKD